MAVFWKEGECGWVEERGAQGRGKRVSTGLEVGLCVVVWEGDLAGVVMTVSE